MSFLNEIQDELDSLGVWPEGVYDFVVIKTIDGKTEDKETPFIRLHLKVIKGELKNRILSHTEWFSKDSYLYSIKRLEPFGVSTELQKATSLEDYMTIQTAELPGKQIRGRVFTDTYRGDKNSRIKAFYPVGRMREAPALDIDEKEEIDDFTRILDEEESF